MPLAHKNVPLLQYQIREAVLVGATLSSDDVLFTSGLGSAISYLYQMLPGSARIALPTPGYPTHIASESFNTGKSPILYKLDPQNEWNPDVADLEEQIKSNPEVAGIVVINPNNPTGAVYSRETLQAMVDLARKYDLFVISDEVYFRMTYGGKRHTHIVELAGDDVPLIVMRGMSKDVPWPGGRCGWLEFYNTDHDEQFATYVAALKKRVMMEVCATRLPQEILGSFYDHPDFPAWIKTYNAKLEKNADEIAQILNNTQGLSVNKTVGAFYMMPLFGEGVLSNSQTLPIENEEVRKYVEELVSVPNFPLDQRFTYYLMASEGIVVVPASGFFSPWPGFRLTTLDRNEKRRNDTYTRVSKAVEAYLASA